MNKIEVDLVQPFYLKMMGLNGLRVMDELWASLTAACRTVTVGEIRWMPGTGHWRPVVMGAWFSVAVPPESVKDDLLAAMSHSQGSLTAPPLAAAAMLVAGPAAVPAMNAYLDFIMSTRRDGSEDIVAAAVEYLGAETSVVPTDSGRRALHDIYGLAMRLREDSPTH